MRALRLDRIFVLKSSTARTSSDFNLRDLPSSSGRLEVVCRCAISAILDSGRIRRDTVFVGVLEGPPSPPLSLRFDGGRLRDLPFSEIALAAMLKDVFGDLEKSDMHVSPCPPGLLVEKKSFNEAISSEMTSNKRGALYYLHEKGEDIRNADMSIQDTKIFIVGDQKGLTAEDEHVLDELRAKRVRVGPISYLSSQVITLVHYELDRKETRRG